MSTPSIDCSPPITSCRIVRDSHGRMRLIKPRPFGPITAKQSVADIHRRATNYARLLMGAGRFQTVPNLSTETISDESVFGNGDWMAGRYSPYLPGGVPTKSRMRVDSFIEKVRVGLLKREPYTIYDKKQKAIMEEILKSRQERNRGQVGDEMRYRFRFWCADRKGRGEIVEELVMNDPRYDGVWDPWRARNSN